MGFYADHCSYLPSMAGWFVFSALLSSYNKLVFGKGNLAFPCPLLLTSIHFLIQWIVSWTLSTMFPLYFGGDRVRTSSWREFLSTSIPCGLTTAGDVGLSNLSMVQISLTFYTMVKASTPIFVLLWAFVFRIERITTSLILVVAIISAGEFLTVLGEVDFDLVGFLLCLSASVLSGARWTLVQLKLQTLEPPLKTAIATMRVLTPSMFFAMFIISLIVERPWLKLGGGTEYFDTVGHGLRTVALGLIGAVFAVSMILCEFYLIMRSNAIVLMIGGVIKEMITILVGVLYFGDPLNTINVGGCVVVFLGVVLYKVTFHLGKLEEKMESSTSTSTPSQKSIRRNEYWPVSVDGSKHNCENGHIVGGSIQLVKEKSINEDVELPNGIEEGVVFCNGTVQPASPRANSGRVRGSLETDDHTSTPTKCGSRVSMTMSTLKVRANRLNNEDLSTIH